MWKEQLKKLEQQEDWDNAIIFMENIIKQYPDDLDAYLFINYLLMNLLGEPHAISKEKAQCYEYLAKKYFNESYTKFAYHKNNLIRAEYLYYTGITAVFGEWYFGITEDDYVAMIEKAQKLDPDNIIYKFHYYTKLLQSNQGNDEICSFAHMILEQDSPFKKVLDTKGSLGEYIFDMRQNWAKSILLEKCL